MSTPSSGKRWYRRWWGILLLVPLIIIILIAVWFFFLVGSYYQKARSGVAVPGAGAHFTRSRRVIPAGNNLGRVANSANDPSFGPETAPVQIIEFGDFECPYTAEASFGIREMMLKYPNQFRYVFRDFPLSDVHPHAFRAALALNCAADQNKFWVMHDKVFANQDNLTDLDLTRYAEQAGLRQDTFSTCFKTEKYKKEIEEDIADGLSAGVQGTPTFFINGQKIQGVIPKDLLEKIITNQ